MGSNCNIGRGAYVGPGVVIGSNCKLQNYALVYEPARLADGVFVGPAAVLTNDLHPRAVTPDGTLKGSEDWDAVGVTVGKGLPSAPAPFALPRYPLARGPRWPPGRLSRGTCRTMPWWSAFRPGRRAGWARPGTR